MEIELKSFTPAEQATFRLRALYEGAGYRKYRASRFEEYALYQEYQRFLPDSQVITFTDLDGKLRAIKPDVTLSIAKTAQPAAGECKRFYYNEEVCRPSRESHTFQTIHQMGLESMGAVDADEQAAVVRLALAKPGRTGCAHRAGSQPHGLSDRPAGRAERPRRGAGQAAGLPACQKRPRTAHRCAGYRAGRHRSRRTDRTA